MTTSLLKKRSSRTVTAQIHKLSGQLAAIERMVATKRSCTEVLAQVEAVRSGLASVAAIVVNEELTKMIRTKHVESADIVKLTKSFIEKT